MILYYDSVEGGVSYRLFVLMQCQWSFLSLMSFLLHCSRVFVINIIQYNTNVEIRVMHHIKDNVAGALYNRAQSALFTISHL